MGISTAITVIIRNIEMNFFREMSESYFFGLDSVYLFISSIDFGEPKLIRF